MRDRYDALYKDNPAYWGMDPSPLSLLALEHCKTGTLLDLGCGQGPDALFFAKKGFDVTAIDLSPIAIRDLAEHAKHAAIPLLAKEGDMWELPQEHFSIIFSRMALQMIAPDERTKYIEKLQLIYPDALHVHIIPISGACFGDEFICDDTLLKEAYANWTVLFSEEVWTIARTRNKKGEPYLMREARIIAKR